MEASEEEVQYFVHATNPMSANQIRLEDYLQVTEDTADWWFVTSFGATHLSLHASSIKPASILRSFLSCNEFTQGHRGSENSELAAVVSSRC